MSMATSIPGYGMFCDESAISRGLSMIVTIPVGALIGLVVGSQRGLGGALLGGLIGGGAGVAVPIAFDQFICPPAKGF